MLSDDSELYRLLHPAERELLREFDDDGPNNDQLASTILRMVAQLQGGRTRAPRTSYPGTVHTAAAQASVSAPAPAPTRARRAPRQTDSTELSPLEKERVQEMAEELADIEKESRRLPAVPTREELINLLDTVRLAAEEGSRNDRRDYLIIRLLYATGCRRSELENMVVADLNTAEQRIFIRDGKGNKDRYVLIDKETARLLNRHTHTYTLKSRVFNIEDRQIARRVKHWAKVTGLTKRYLAQGRTFTAHCLRHAFATHMYEGGANLFTLRELLGHQYLSTTRIYVSIGIGKLLTDYQNSHPLCLADG